MLAAESRSDYRSVDGKKGYRWDIVSSGALAVAEGNTMAGLSLTMTTAKGPKALMEKKADCFKIYIIMATITCL